MNSNIEVLLPCGSTVSIKKIRTSTEAINSEWLPYISIFYSGEAYAYVVNSPCKDEVSLVNIPIQLRSIDSLVELLLKAKEEMLK